MPGLYWIALSVVLFVGAAISSLYNLPQIGRGIRKVNNAATTFFGGYFIITLIAGGLLLFGIFSLLLL